MPRYGPFIHQVYIADGFADDCDELIHRCLKLENLDYHVFCKIWKEMNMGCVYEGRTLGAEIGELSEELIHIGKHYMLKNTSNFEESVIGVFIVYALLNLQPYKGFAHLRLVPEDLPAINRIEHVARRDKRYEVLYALGSILTKGPVQYHAAEREYGMSITVRKYLEGFTSIDKLGVRPKGVFRRQNEELDVLKDLHSITQKYTQAKMLISKTAQFDRNLKYINPNLPNELETSLKKLISGIHEENYETLGEGYRCDDGEEISKSRQRIKEKAMKQDVNPVRHLVNSTDRKTNTSKSPKKEKTETNPKKKANKDKITVSKDQRKRRIPISPRALKKIRTSELNASKYENDKSNVKVSELSEAGDDIVRMIKLSDESQEADSMKSNKTMLEKEESEQELNIEIDTLPVLIRTEDQGKLFEIEIIDQKQSNTKPEGKPVMKTYQQKVCPLKKINSMPGISIEKIVYPEAAKVAPSTSSASDFAKIVGINVKNKKKGNHKTVQAKQDVSVASSKMEKRDCKRIHVQSRFKRMGMLPVANFNEDEFAEQESNKDDLDDKPSVNLGLDTIDN